MLTLAHMYHSKRIVLKRWQLIPMLCGRHGGRARRGRTGDGSLVLHASIHVFVVGNCPTHPDGLGNNMSKLVLASKAAGIWHGRHSGVHAHVSVLDFTTA
jgi:hypothetical protein